MSLTLNGSSPAITFPDGSTQTTAVNITTPYTANGVVYASSTSALATGSGLTWDGNTFTLGNSAGTITALVKSTGSGWADVRLQAGTSNGGHLYFNNGTTDAGSIFYYHPSDYMSFTTASSERMRLNSSGYLGIGTSSPTYQLDVKGGLNVTGNWNTIARFENTANTQGIALGYNTSTTNSLIVAIEQGSGLELWTNNGVGGGWGAKVTLDAFGNLGLGVTPSGWDTGNNVKALQIYQGALWGYGTTNTYLASNYYWNGTNRIYSRTAAAGEYQIAGGQHIWSIAASGTAGNAISFTQAMTLDNSGNLLVGTTSGSSKLVVTTSSGTGAYLTFDGSVGNGINLKTTYSSTGSLYINFINSAGSSAGSITQSGTTAVAYNTSSDQRLKTNIVDAPAGNIDQIKIRSFDWKSDGSHNTYGVIAQELLEVAPYAVHVPANSEEMMGVDYSKLVPMMIKEIQSLKAEVATLKGA